MSHLRLLFAAAILILSLVVTMAATSNDLNLSIANVSEPTPGTITHSTIYDENDNAYEITLTVVEPNLVQAANDNIPDEEKMAKNKWQGQAPIEVYMLSDVVNTVGNVTGSLLYGAVWQHLNTMCPARIGVNDNPSCWKVDQQISIRYKNGKQGGFSETLSQITVLSSKFGNPAARTALFGALAASYEAMTANDRNCFTVKDAAYGNRYCNVAQHASVFTEDSHIYMSLSSDIRDDSSDGLWNCCETREFVDSKLDTGVVAEFKGIYPTPRDKDRLVECHMGCTDKQRVSLIDIDKMLIDVMDYQFW